jgi:hypothetical protein
MRWFGLLYRGPRAWLVWLNRLITCFALIPAFLFCMVWLFHALGPYLGEAAMLPEMFPALLLGAIGEAGYMVCVPVLLPACLLLPALILTPGIPQRIKLVTAGIELAALVLMSWLVATLTRLFQQGHSGLFS